MRDGSLPEQARAELPLRPLGIYIHVPVCATRCGYCDFNTYTPGELGGFTPAGWLAEVYRNTALKRVCQSELCEVYDHKHQSLERDPEQGLLKMCTDIAKNLFRTLASEGVVIAPEHLMTIYSRYQRTAEDMIDWYHADAAINGLHFDRHEEETAVETFVRGLKSAGETFLEDPMGIPLIPNWNRVNSALPQFVEELRDAVEADNRRLATHTA